MPTGSMQPQLKLRSGDRITEIKQYSAELESAGRLTPAVREAIDRAIGATQEHDVIFYIAGALTGVDETTKHRYTQASRLIQTYNESPVKMFGYAPHLYGTDPVRHPDVTPAEVRDIDYLWAVKTADCHINFPYPIAHGSAIEEGWAEGAGIPALYVVPRDVRLSRLMIGMRNIIGTILYDNFEQDGLPQVQEFLKRARD